MKKLIVLNIVFWMAAGLYAQQLPHYTQYQINDYVTNPAIGGSRPYFDAKLNSRYQWVGITDAPRTYIFSLHGPVYKDVMGIGGYVYTDVTGPTRRTGAQISYSYHLKLNEMFKLSFGITGGVLQYIADGGKVRLAEQGDIAWSNGLQVATKPDAGAGLYLYSDKFFFGLSAPQLIGGKLNMFDDYEETKSELARHFFLATGYTYDINDDFSIQPTLFVKYVNPVPPQMDISVRGIYREEVWLGGSYRTTISPFEADAATVMVGYIFQKNLSIGYSYDISISNIRRFSNGSHEVMFGIRFGDTGVSSAAPTE